MVKVSVIVTVMNDKRIFDLIHALEQQTLKNFEVLILDASEKKLFDKKTLKTKLNLRYFHKKSMKIADAFNFLAKRAKAKTIAITESDCVPSKKWLEELISEYENDKTIIVGTQKMPEAINNGNLLIPKKAFEVPHDKNLRYADDLDWFLSLKERGFRFKHVDKAVVTHYKDPVKRLFRSTIYGREHAYVYIKHKQEKRILNSILYQLAKSLFSFLMAVLLIIYGIFYKIKHWLSR